MYRSADQLRRWAVVRKAGRRDGATEPVRLRNAPPSLGCDRDVVAGLRGASAELEAHFDRAADEADRLIGVRAR
jgi:hypothetical protein